MNKKFVFSWWQSFSIIRKIAIINMFLFLLIGLGIFICLRIIPNNSISKHITFYMLTVPMTIWFLGLSLDGILTGKLWFGLPNWEYSFKTDPVRFLLVLITFMFFGGLFIYSWFHLNQLIK